MVAVAVILLGILAFLQAEGPVTQTVAIILAGAATIIAILALAGFHPLARRSPPG